MDEEPGEDVIRASPQRQKASFCNGHNLGPERGSICKRAVIVMVCLVGERRLGHAGQRKKVCISGVRGTHK